MLMFDFSLRGLRLYLPLVLYDRKIYTFIRNIKDRQDSQVFIRTLIVGN